MAGRPTLNLAECGQTQAMWVIVARCWPKSGQPCKMRSQGFSNGAGLRHLWPNRICHLLVWRAALRHLLAPACGGALRLPGGGEPGPLAAAPASSLGPSAPGRAQLLESAPVGSVPVVVCTRPVRTHLALGRRRATMCELGSSAVACTM